MSDDTISISELETARAAMTGGDWGVDFDPNDQANIYARGQPTDWIALLPHQCVKSIEEEQKLNAAGICALHAASPALIAVVKTALAHEQARVTFEMSAENDDRPVFEGHRARMQQAHRELLAALARFHP